MTSVKNISIIILLISQFIFVSCGTKQTKKINVFVSIEPQKFFVEKIGGEKVDVSIFVKSGLSPENFEPLPLQLMKLSKTDLYFAIGLQFESRIINSIESTNTFLRIVNTGQNIKHRKSESHIGVLGSYDHNSNINDGHTHGLHDPHIWLSPTLVKQQAKTIMESLTELDSTNGEFYFNNYTIFTTEIDSVINIISNNLQNVANRNLLVFHPAWGYFCDEFNLSQIPIELEGKEPGIKDLSYVIDFINLNKSDYILAEKQNSSPTLKSIAEELKIKIIKHDPLAEDYFKNLILLSEIIKVNNL